MRARMRATSHVTPVCMAGGGKGGGVVKSSAGWGVGDGLVYGEEGVVRQGTQGHCGMPMYR